MDDLLFFALPGRASLELHEALGEVLLVLELEAAGVGQGCRIDSHKVRSLITTTLAIVHRIEPLVVARKNLVLGVFEDILCRVLIEVVASRVLTVPSWRPAHAATTRSITNILSPIFRILTAPELALALVLHASFVCLNPLRHGAQ